MKYRLRLAGALAPSVLVAAAIASPFNVAGTYSGAVNGTSFTATSTGWMNPDNGSLDVAVDFSTMPVNYGIQLPASCWICFICCNGRLEVNNAVNMLDLTGGTYSFNRTLTYADGSQVTLNGSTLFDAATRTLSYDVVWGGTCTIDASAISAISWPVVERFTQAGPGNVRAFGTADLVTATGTTPVRFEGNLLYGNGNALPFDETAYLTATLEYSGEPDCMLRVTGGPGSSYIVPAPGAMVLAGAGLLMCGRRRNRACG